LRRLHHEKNERGEPISTESQKGEGKYKSQKKNSVTVPVEGFARIGRIGKMTQEKEARENQYQDCSL